MMDRVSPEVRSRNMARIRGKDTKPEVQVRRLLHSLGYRFRVHAPSLPGKADIAFSRRKKVVFVHGCFWHQHHRCPKAATPVSRADFWRQKFDKNRERDRRVEGALVAQGWEVLVVWECETRRPDEMRQRLMEFLGPVRMCGELRAC